MQSTTTDEKVEYNRISLEDSDLEPGDSLLSHQNSSKNKRNNALSIANPSWAVWIHVALGIIWVLLFGLLTFMRTSNTGESPDHTSPLFPALSYSRIKYTSGFAPDLSPFQGKPDDANNAAWDEITHLGMVALTEAEQAKLIEPTSVFMNNTENSGNGVLYLGAVEVFHQLHCLDMLRLEIYGELEPWYKKHSPHNIHTKPGHLEHCIDYIRQSMMCRPSLDILPFWTDTEDNFRPTFNGSRTCANFDSIKDWASKRKAGNLSPQ